MPQRHRPELSESVSGEAPVTYRRTPRTFRPGRTCAAAGCPTVLSIYNSGKFCAVHNAVDSRPGPVAEPDEVLVTTVAEEASGQRARARARIRLDPPGQVGRRAS
jgi:hypothetical protein